MPTLQEIEHPVKQLTKAEREALRDWLENVLEDELEMTDEFKAKIERVSSNDFEAFLRLSTSRAARSCRSRAKDF